MTPLLHCAHGRSVSLAEPVVMGIVNTTPDSFSDGGLHRQRDRAIEGALAMWQAGAGIIDIGGESTRPGAAPVSIEDERERVLPVLRELLRAEPALICSIDTSKPDLMREALEAGAHIINDVNALRAPGAVRIAAQAQAAVVLMHRRGDPLTMQDNPEYADVSAEVTDFLLERSRDCQAHGVAAESIVLDPGFGFGKRLEHNYTLLRELPALCAQGYPVLAGMSRKGMLGSVTGRAVDDRLAATIAVHTLALQLGARIIRVHDVAEAVDACRVWSATNL